ncbi:MAG: hypothetical protein KA954_13215, partial [Chitinophagales bacterium]|nr:hypothetical protein [Chitinophagales bacterium]
GAYDYIVKNATSFIHVENTIERLFKHRSVIKNLEKYRTLNRVLIWGLILIVALSVGLFYSGIIN